MRRLYTLFKITDLREFLQIIFLHFFQRKLALANPVLHRVLVFGIACSDKYIEISRHSHELLLLKWTEQNTLVQFYVRKYSRDLLVFTQFFIDEDFRQNINGLHIKDPMDFKFVVDAGANIGCSALLLHLLFPQAKIVCVEPEASNYKLLQNNIQINGFSSKIVALQNALWNEVTELDLMQRDWSHDGFHVMKKINADEVISKTTTVTVPKLMKDYGYNQINLLKIDIEGAEKTIFSDSQHVDEFLPNTRNLVIEVHNEFISDEAILGLLKNYDFECEKSIFTDQPTVIIARNNSFKN